MGKPSRFIVLVDCLDKDEIGNENEYLDIYEDMREMFVNYGLVRNIRIPRHGEEGCGNVIIEYDNVSQAVAAQQAVHGKPFSGKAVVAQFLEETNHTTHSGLEK